MCYVIPDAVRYSGILFCRYTVLHSRFQCLLLLVSGIFVLLTVAGFFDTHCFSYVTVAVLYRLISVLSLLPGWTGVILNLNYNPCKIRLSSNSVSFSVSLCLSLSHSVSVCLSVCPSVCLSVCLCLVLKALSSPF